MSHYEPGNRGNILINGLLLSALWLSLGRTLCLSSGEFSARSQNTKAGLASSVLCAAEAECVTVTSDFPSPVLNIGQSLKLELQTIHRFIQSRKPSQGSQRNYCKVRDGWLLCRIYANQPACSLRSLRRHPNFMSTYRGLMPIWESVLIVF